MVGAVVLDAAGQLAGEGFHARRAIRTPSRSARRGGAAERARDGTLYVNLEPCNHAHRTPPCAQAVIDAGMARVVVSMADPDDRVRGAGLSMLEQAGVATTLGTLRTARAGSTSSTSSTALTGRPFVTAKFAMSLDGKIATQDRRVAVDHRRRGRAPAWPQVASHARRHPGWREHRRRRRPAADRPYRRPGLEPAARVVLDSQLRTRQSARVVGVDTLIATTRAGRVGAAEVVRLPADAAGRVSLPALLDELGARNPDQPPGRRWRRGPCLVLWRRPRRQGPCLRRPQRDRRPGGAGPRRRPGQSSTWPRRRVSKSSTWCGSGTTS